MFSKPATSRKIRRPNMPSLIKTKIESNLILHWKLAEDYFNKHEYKKALQECELIRLEFKAERDIEKSLERAKEDREKKEKALKKEKEPETEEQKEEKKSKQSKQEKYNLIMQHYIKIQGDIYFRTQRILDALLSYDNLRIVSGITKDYKEQLYAYKQLGMCYKLIKEYHFALSYFKKMLQLAWYLKDVENELSAYDLIGVAYYYMGDLEKSKYYHRRMWEGICEDKKSSVRQISLASLEAKRQRQLKDPAVEIAKIDKILESENTYSHLTNVSDDDLPSPRTGSGENDHSLLPFYQAVTLQPKIIKKPTMHKSLTSRIKPFVLLSHLSPIESPNNYFYVEEMNQFKNPQQKPGSARKEKFENELEAN